MTSEVDNILSEKEYILKSQNKCSLIIRNMEKKITSLKKWCSINNITVSDSEEIVILWCIRWKTKVSKEIEELSNEIEIYYKEIFKIKNLEQLKAYLESIEFGEKKIDLDKKFPDLLSLISDIIPTLTGDLDKIKTYQMLQTHTPQQIQIFKKEEEKKIDIQIKDMLKDVFKIINDKR